MSEITDKIINEFMTQNFSPEITDEEAKLFIISHPNQRWAIAILMGYTLCKSIVDSPYIALRIAIKSYLETVTEE